MISKITLIQSLDIKSYLNKLSSESAFQVFPVWIPKDQMQAIFLMHRRRELLFLYFLISFVPHHPQMMFPKQLRSGMIHSQSQHHESLCIHKSGYKISQHFPPQIPTTLRTFIVPKLNSFCYQVNKNSHFLPSH